MEKRMTRMKIHLFCTSAWVVSIVFHTPYFMATFHQKTGDGHYKCINKIMTHFPSYVPVVYFILRRVVQAILPVSMMVFFYIKIQRALKQSNKIAIQTSNASTTTKRNNDTMKALRLALIVFAITVLLNNASHLFRAVTSLYFPSIWEEMGGIRSLVDLLIRALAVNNVANCFIYAGTMKDFKKYAVSVLLCEGIRSKMQTKQNRIVLKQEAVVVRGSRGKKASIKTTESEKEAN